MNNTQTKPKPCVLVDDFKIVNKGSLRAFFTATIGGLVIHSCRLIQENGKAGWVSLPQSEWIGGDGKKRYSPVIEVPDHVKAAIQEAALAAWRAQ